VGQGRVTETELIPRLVGGDAELCCGKLKKGKGFLKPNFELGPNDIWAADLKGVSMTQGLHPNYQCANLGRPDNQLGIDHLGTHALAIDDFHQFVDQ
jgi:hypothetical protein